MRAFPPPRRSDAKNAHSPVCDSFFLACRVKNPPTCVRAHQNPEHIRVSRFFAETFSGNPEELRKVGPPRLRPFGGGEVSIGC